MAAIAIRKNAFDNASTGQKNVLRLGLEKLQLGTPAVYTDQGGTTEWYIFSDRRVGLNDVKWLGWLIEVLADVQDIDAVPVSDVEFYETVEVEVPVRVQVEVPVTEPIFDDDGEYVGEEPVLDEDGDPVTQLVWRNHPTDTVMVEVEQPLGDPYALVLEAQTDSPVIKAADQVPASWTPVTEEV